MVFRTSLALRDLVPWPGEDSAGGSGRRWLAIGVLLAVIVVLLILRPW
jgi:hypothetical protein